MPDFTADTTGLVVTELVRDLRGTADTTGLVVTELVRDLRGTDYYWWYNAPFVYIAAGEADALGDAPNAIASITLGYLEANIEGMPVTAILGLAWAIVAATAEATGVATTPMVYLAPTPSIIIPPVPPSRIPIPDSDPTNKFPTLPPLYAQINRLSSFAASIFGTSVPPWQTILQDAARVTILASIPTRI